MPQRTKKKPQPEPAPARWVDCLAEFDHHLIANERSPHTRRNYRHDLAAFARWYEQTHGGPLQDLGQVDSEHCRLWKEAMRGDRATATINRRLAALGSLLNWAFHTRRMPAQVDRPKSIRQKRLGHRGLERKAERYFLTAVEHASPRDRAVIYILLYTGLRVDELAKLTWRKLKLIERKGTITVQGKGDKTRLVPIVPKVRAALEVLGLAEHRGTDQRIVQGQRGPLHCRAIQAIVEKFGINAHMLRHTFAHNFLKAGGGLEQLADILGHEDLETTRRYVIPSTGDLQVAMERMGADA
jgi:integrase/recombinase XerD